MSEKNTRELVSWRIGKLPDSDQLNKWVNAQGNIQNSITSLVRHMIEQFGYRDITSHDIQKTLFQKSIADELKLVLSKLSNAPLLPEENDRLRSTSSPALEVEEDEAAPVKSEHNTKANNDDIYKMIDKSSF